MSGGAYITTSWDDGHPLDFRVADFAYGVRACGTFYVPKESDRVTMSAIPRPGSEHFI